VITAVKAENVSAYKALFEEASDILSGYKRVRTYDSKVTEYFYKDAEATEATELFKKETSINSLTTFAKALETYSVLYVKNGEPAEGFEPMLGITTLEEYFSWIRNLGNINRKYTILPLDEDHFEINANTRAINIPASFKKNGVAVQGDDLAEVLYFKVDRYFDYMDLNNTDIYIQWETPKDPATGTTTKSVSPAYIRDIESEPGKLIFGWALSDAITKQSGNLKFSVRFFQWEDPDKINIENGAITEDSKKVIAYSFSTLTAQVSINPSINFNPEADEFLIDDVGNRLVERLENSEIVGGYAAAVPDFIKDLDDPNLSCEYDLDETTGLFDLLVQAYSTDTGSITYTWKKQGLSEDNEGIGEDIVVVESSNKMVEVEDLTALNPAFHYYQTNGTDANGKPIYTRYTGTIPPSAEDLADENFTLYERQSMHTADSVGIYWAVAENRITNSSSSELSKRAIFPRPKYIVISEQPTDRVILTDVEGDEKGAFANIGVMVEEADSTVQKKSYQWFKDDNYTLNFGNVAPDFKAIEGATEATYEVTEPGHYRVVITNTRNKATKTLESAISRVTNPAAAPQLIEGGVNSKNFKVDSLTPDNCPTVYINSAVESDGYTVTWFLSENDKSTPIVEDIVLAAGVYNASFNPQDYREKIVEISNDKDIDGAYYAIVTNHVNGSSESTGVPAYEDMFKITY
jgi:hypothetical protein